MSNLMLPNKELAKLDPMTSVSRALLTLKQYNSKDWLVLHTLDLLREALLIQDAKAKRRSKRESMMRRHKSQKNTPK